MAHMLNDLDSSRRAPKVSSWSPKTAGYMGSRE